jgi:spermidine synthase
LLLGLGGGSVIKSLRRVFHYELGIVAVEIDPVIIQIANDEFGVIADERTEIVCADAFEYVTGNNKKFDLIIIDLFIDNRVPEKLFSIEFWERVKARVRSNGSIIFNSINENSKVFEPIRSQLKWRFLIREYENVEKVNHLLIAKSRQ